MRLAGTKLAANHQYRGFGDQLYDLSGQRPSLDLNFSSTKSLVDATTGQNLVTFTRASSGTYVDSQGVIRTATTNEARFDHAPTTGESLGLLVEEQRTNLLLRSEEFDNASWTLTRIAAFGSGSVANAVTAPNGSLTADKIVEDGTASNTHFVQQLLAVSSGVQYTASVYVKAGERNWVLFNTAGTPFGTNGQYVNLSTGAIGSTVGTVEGFSVTPVGNDWYRLRWTATTTSAGNGGFQVRLANANNGQSYNGDGTSGIYLWGAQLEAGAFPTSYIPTTTAAVTRSADVASITGSNFSSWYRQDEGTFFWSGSSYATQYSNQNPFRVTEGTNLRGIGFGLDGRTGSDDAYFSTRNNTNITSANSTFPYVVGNSNIRIGGAFGTDVAASFSGSAPIVSSPAYVFGTENQIEIMGNKAISGTSNQYNGHTRRLTYFPTRLANETLQMITQ